MVVVYNSSVESCFRNPNYSMNIEGQNKLRPRLIKIEKSSTVSVMMLYFIFYCKNYNKYFLYKIIQSYKTLTMHNSQKTLRKCN